MRVTQSMYYDSIYSTNNNKLTSELFDVNKQIASGLSIQYASDNVTTFVDTMRLDNEVTTLGQIKKSTESGAKVSDQTDATLTDFEDNMTRMKTLLIQAANGTQDDTSLDSIAQELRAIEKSLKADANTSINGKYLFSGSDLSTKPIDENGIYQGNDAILNAFVGSNNQQQYNISGSELFLGEEANINREVTTNVVNSDLINGGSLSPTSSLRQLMGDKDDDETTVNTNYFYLRGAKSDGTAIKEKIALDDTQDISVLLERIGTAYGNDGDVNVVDVTMNSEGQIIVTDKLNGSSKLDFHMVGAVDYSGGTAADVDDIDDLDNGETTYKPNGDLFVKEFLKSGLESADGAASNIEGLVYDRTKFEKDGFLLSSNVSNIVREDNSFATISTKISEVADISQTPNAGTLDGSKLNLEGTNINGDSYTVTINFIKNDPADTTKNGSTFSVDTDGDGIVDTDYNIYDMDPDGRKAVNADDMTYQQLMDVVNMVVTNNLPEDDTVEKYDKAINESNFNGNTYLSYDGKLQFKDFTGSTDGTKASISLYDPNSEDFSTDASASIMTFNTNNSLTISDPKTDFFKTIDEIITSVEDHKLYPDAQSGTLRNVGIENSISMIDELSDHVARIHSKVGAQSNALSMSSQRTSLLETSTISLRSDIIDTDIAEASLRLTQLDTNYQAMLSTVGKISQLSLVNYL